MIGPPPCPAYRSALDNGIERLFHYQKYRSEFLENTVKNGVVRFSRASEFNDPWDCKPSFFVPDDGRELERLVEFMQRASERHTPEVDPEFRRARREQYLNKPDQLRRDLVDAAAEMWAQMDRRYRLYCLSTRPDCPLMWGHYADHHRGVCLEFNVRTPDFCSAIEVNYLVPSILNSHWLTAVIFRHFTASQPTGPTNRNIGLSPKKRVKRWRRGP